MSKILLRVAAFAGAIAFPQSSHSQWQLNGAPVCSDPAGQSGPAVAEDGAGGAVVVWVDARNGNADLFAQRLDASGSPLWTLDGVPVCVDIAHQFAPVIVPAAGGGWIVAWVDRRDPNGLVFAQKLDASGSAQWTAGGISVCACGTVLLDEPRIVADDLGGAYVVYQATAAGLTTLLASRVDSDGDVLWSGQPVGDGGAGMRSHRVVGLDGHPLVAWQQASDIRAQLLDPATGQRLLGPSGAPVCTATGHQDHPAIVPDGLDEFVVAWGDNRSVTSVDVYVQKLDDTGAALWAADGVVLSPSGGFAGDPVIVIGGAGVIVVWPTGNPHLFAQSLDPSGAPTWGSGLRLVAPTMEMQINPQVRGDGAGGVVAVWETAALLGPPSHDLYAQRLDATGARLWGDEGLIVCNEASHQSLLAVAGDGVDGLIAAWEDARSGDFSDIYAQHVPPAATGIGGTQVPAAFSALRHYPNPFAATAVIEFEMKTESAVELDLFDARGRRLFARKMGPFGTGAQRVIIEAVDDNGRALASGVYFARLTSAAGSVTRKIVIAR